LHKPRAINSIEFGHWVIQLASKPRFYELPVPVYGSLRHAERFRCFRVRKASEHAKFYEAGLAGVETLEPQESFIETDEGPDVWFHGHGWIELHVRRASAALLCQLGARVVHENAAHDLGSQGEELCAVLPGLWADSNQA
jgi:hypothetical protein